MASNYDPGRVVFSFGSILITGGYMDGTFIACERAEDAFSMSVGAAGDVTRVRSRNRTGSVTLTLQAASSLNDSLTAIAVADELFGTGSYPLQVKDLNGNTVVEAPAAWIRKRPATEFADEASGREWVFDCDNLNIVAGGATV